MHIFISGLFLFLLGLEGSKRGLKGLTISGVERILKGLSEHLYLGILIGTVVTGILQSSSAVTVILIGLLEAGLINFKSAMTIVLGANIGTTITVQLISLPVVDSYLYLIFAGLFFMITGFIFKKKIIPAGLTLTSFGVVFAGLKIMTAYFQNPAASEIARKILAFSGNNFLLGILLGIIITGIIQSSSAVTGITVSLAYSNLITLPVAIAIALGSNIGTCITAFLASLNCRHTTRSLAWGHFWFNLIGVFFILPFVPYFIKLVNWTSPNLVRQIANSHTIFNIVNVIIFMPFFETFVSFFKEE